MDAALISLGVLSAAAAAFGLRAAGRLIPSARPLPPMLNEEEAESIAEPRRAAHFRRTAMMGIAGDLVRYRDGGFGRGFAVSLPAGAFEPTAATDRRCDSLARLLTMPKPPGTVISFRLASDADFGEVLWEQTERLERVPPSSGIARRLHAGSIGHLKSLAEKGAFRASDVICWMRVPTEAASDKRFSGVSGALEHLFGSGGWKRKFGAAGEVFRDPDLIRRLAEDERACRTRAERVTSELAAAFPNEVRVRPLTREETFCALYAGHHPDARSGPRPPKSGWIPLEGYLENSPLKYESDVVWHGNVPAALISLTVMPHADEDQVIDASLPVVFEQSAALSFPCVIGVDYVFLDQNKEKAARDKRIGQLRRAGNGAFGKRELSPEGQKALQDNLAIRNAIAGNADAMIDARVFAVVFGPAVAPSVRKKGREAALAALDERCDAVLRHFRTWPGADAIRETGGALRCLYESALLGEAGPARNDREHTDVASTLAALAPARRPWAGYARPHTVVGTRAGRLCGLDLFDTSLTGSPLSLVLGATRSGKSVFLSQIMADVLSAKADARVRCIDFGESFGPLARVLGGRHIRFDAQSTLNVWDYAGIERGDMPDAVQVQLVVGDLMLLARIPESDAVAEAVLHSVVQAVYVNEVPRNTLGIGRHEPRLSNLLDLLDGFPFEEEALRRRASELRLVLERYRGDAWLDAPTSTAFHADSPIDVYELDSLGGLPAAVRASIAYRIAARVTRLTGTLRRDGTRAPMLLVIDELHKIAREFREMIPAIERGARQGGKENVVTMLASHEWGDFSGLPGVTSNAGTCYVALQNDSLDALAAARELTPAMVAGIRSLTTVPGKYAEIAVHIRGTDEIFEILVHRLDPVNFWIRTSNPVDRNVRERTRRLLPHLSELELAERLASIWPNGVGSAGLEEPAGDALEKQVSGVGAIRTVARP